MSLSADQLAQLTTDLDNLKAAVASDTQADADTAADVAAQTALDGQKATHVANKTATAQAVLDTEAKLLSDAQSDFAPSA